MKTNIKSLLTGTTLFVASTSNINAVPPKGIELIDGAMITHPVFGEMKVISHKEDLDFYHQKVKDPNKSLFENEYDEGVLAKNFIKYVLNADSLKQANIPQSDIAKFVEETCYSQAGMAALKVITANYMREYDRIKQFCENHQAELKACYDFSQTEEGKEFYEKERQIFELEEKLKELFNRKIDPFRHSSPKIEISSRNDLLNLYNHFQKEKNLCDKELKPFCELLSNIPSIDTDDYHAFLTLYTFFSSGGETDKKDIKVGNRRIKYGSNEYDGLQKLCSQFKKQLEKFFSIDDLCLSEKTLKRGSKEEDRTRCCYLKYEDDLKALSDLCDKGSAQQIDSVQKLAQAYREETKEENEKKFSCIRRSVMPACYFPILYRHFLVENDLEYTDIKAVNKFLYRALKLENDDESCVFMPATLSIGLRTMAENFEGYHIHSDGNYYGFKSSRYSSLLHELMHFMNAVDCFETADGAEIGLTTRKSKVIEKTEGVLKLKPEVRRSLSEALGKLYDNNLETWTMYGIFICKNNTESGGYKFYYDPINEAVSDSECKIIGGAQKQVVRTGHSVCFNDKAAELNEKIGIYQFYFDKGETLRNLINK